MRILADTERPEQSALDRAVVSILTEGAVRGGLQKCEECREWAKINNLEYICQAVLLDPEAGSPPSLKIQLKTRYPHFICPEGCANQQKQTDNGEQEHQLSPVHVQAVYGIDGGNVNTIIQGFVIVCPDCGDESPVLSSQRAVQQHIQDHIGVSSTAAAAAAGAADHSALGGQRCPLLAACFNQGFYSNTAAFGSTAANLGDQSAPPAANDAAAAAAPERLYKQLLARITVCCAVHILSATRPIEGAAAAAASMQAAATAAAAADSDASSSSAGYLLTELLPWRPWAASCLKQNLDLLQYANWARPRLQPQHSNDAVTLLDVVFAPPFTAVSGSEAGSCAHKLAAVLKRLRQRHIGSRPKRYRGEAAAASSSKRARRSDADTAAVAVIENDKDDDGDDATDPTCSAAQAAATATAAAAEPAAAAASGTLTADQLLSELLLTDSVFKYHQQQQRVAEFLQQAAITREDLAAAMTSKVVNNHVQLCGGCGRSEMQLGKSVKLHRCSNCVACICEECYNIGLNQEAAETQTAAAPAAAPPEAAAAAAAAPQAAAAAAAAAEKERVMCRWCTDHGSHIDGNNTHTNGGSSSTRKRRKSAVHTAAAANAAAGAAAAPSLISPQRAAAAAAAAATHWGKALRHPTVGSIAAASSSSSSTPWFTDTAAHPLTEAQIKAVAAQFAAATKQQLTPQQRQELQDFRSRNRWRSVIPAKHLTPPGWLELEVEREVSHSRVADPYYLPPDGTSFNPPKNGKYIRSGPDIQRYLASPEQTPAQGNAPQRDSAEPGSAQGNLIRFDSAPVNSAQQTHGQGNAAQGDSSEPRSAQGNLIRFDSAPVNIAQHTAGQGNAADISRAQTRLRHGNSNQGNAAQAEGCAQGNDAQPDQHDFVQDVDGQRASAAAQVSEAATSVVTDAEEEHDSAAPAAAAANPNAAADTAASHSADTAAGTAVFDSHEQQSHAAASETGPQQQQQQQRALQEADDMERDLNSGLLQLMRTPGLTTAARMVLAAMQQKKRQLLLHSRTQAPAAAAAAASGVADVGQAPALQGLQVLRKVVSSLLQLPNDVSRIWLLECLGVCWSSGAIPAAAAAAAAAGSSGLAGSSKSTTVLDQLIDCWGQEARLTGCSVQQSIAAAACAVAAVAAAHAVEPSSSSPEAQSYLSGLSCMVLQLLTRCCAASATAANVGANSSIGHPKLQQLAQDLVKGTTVLLLSTPVAAAAGDDGVGWLMQAAFWRQSVWCSLQRLQEGAGERGGAEQLTAVFSEVEGQLQELQRHFDAV